MIGNTASGCVAVYTLLREVRVFLLRQNAAPRSVSQHTNSVLNPFVIWS